MLRKLCFLVVDIDKYHEGRARKAGKVNLICQKPFWIAFFFNLYKMKLHYHSTVLSVARRLGAKEGLVRQPSFASGPGSRMEWNLVCHWNLVYFHSLPWIKTSYSKVVFRLDQVPSRNEDEGLTDNMHLTDLHADQKHTMEESIVPISISRIHTFVKKTHFSI